MKMWAIMTVHTYMFESLYTIEYTLKREKKNLAVFLFNLLINYKSKCIKNCDSLYALDLVMHLSFLKTTLWHGY